MVVSLTATGNAASILVYLTDCSDDLDNYLLLQTDLLDRVRVRTEEHHNFQNRPS